MGRTANPGQLLRLAVPTATDRDLLAAFAGGSGEGAFVELVRRHGPMVLAVCRRVLRHEHDAEDAFQAAFLVLARKAARVGGPSVANWLFGVARHVALRAREKDVRRLRREAAVVSPEKTEADPDRDEAITALDEELGRLPEKYRSPLVAFYLQGLSQEEVAREFGWSISTVRRRLEQGREVLRTRLMSRGVTLPAGALAIATVSPALAEATGLAAIAFLNGSRGTIRGVLAGEVLAMMARKTLVKTVIFLALALGGVTLAWQAATGRDNGTAQEPRVVQEPGNKPKEVQPPPPNDPMKVEDRIKRGDRLRIKVREAFPDEPIDGVFVVEPLGTVPFGPVYGGRVQVAGMTLVEAEHAITEHLKKVLRNPMVSVIRDDPVAPDRLKKLEDRVQRLEQEVIDLRALIRVQK
jgi:RNA polymerase sigma factor (sigma-70 family)